jgi:phospholipid transport system substrate-binding protein
MLPYLLKSILIFSLLCSSAAAAVQETQADKLMRTIDAALDVIYSDASAAMSDEAKQAQVRAAIEANYDLDVIIRYAIGRNWRRFSESEQTEVLDLVKQLVLKAYVKGLDGKARPVVKLGKVVQVSDSRMEIPTEILLDETTYYVVYRLRQMQSGWQIYDIIAENVSVSSNYREQINDHFRRGTAAELIARLKELLAEDDIDEDIQL